MNSVSAPVATGARVSPPAVPPAGGGEAPPRAGWPVAVLGVPFDHVTIDDAIGRIEAMIASRQPHYVVTANVDFLVQAHRDVELRRILLDADLVLCDGTPILWASRWLGNALPERVAGSDLAPALMRTAAQKGYRVFFLGAAPGVAAQAAERLQQQYPGINIVGHYAPPFANLLEMDHEQIAQRIRAAQPDLLLVSFGCPKQEKWIAMHHRALGVPVAIGVGATIDFLAGRLSRAPAWMRRSGTEWVYRLAQEPRRLFRRYANDLVFFLPTLAAQWWRLGSRRASSTGTHALASTVPQWFCIEAGERLTRGALEREADFWQQVPRDAHCVIDLSRVRSVDGTGVAFLARWRKQLAMQRRHLVLLAPSASVRDALTSTRLADHFTIARDAAEATQLAESLLVQPTVRRDGTTRTIAWCGEIVAANVEDVWRTTTDHITAFVAHSATLIIVDLSRLKFIDSSGAALMLRLKKWAHGLSVELLFSNVQPNVRNVLHLTRLDQLLLEGAQ